MGFIIFVCGVVLLLLLLLIMLMLLLKYVNCKVNSLLMNNLFFSYDH